MCLVSLVIPVYNTERYLAKCLESILMQSYPYTEIIIVNDGSVDESEVIIKQFINNYSNKIIYLKQVNQGPSVARNLGVQAANGKYIMFIDSDDYIGHSWVQSFVTTAENNNADMVYSVGNTHIFEFNDEQKVVIYPDDKLLFRVRGPWGHMYRKDFLVQHGLVFPDKCNYEDNYLNLAIEYFTKKSFPVDTVEYFYLQRESSLRFTSWKKVDDSRFPYEKFTSLFEDARCGETKVNSKFEFSVIRFFTAVIFSNGRRSDIAVIKRLCTFFANCLRTYFPHYYKNEHLNPFKYTNAPLTERFGIWFFVQLVRCRLLKFFAVIYTRF